MWFFLWLVKPNAYTDLPNLSFPFFATSAYKEDQLHGGGGGGGGGDSLSTVVILMVRFVKHFTYRNWKG